MAVKKVFEGVVEYDAEDGGQALVATIYDEVPEANSGMFVRLQSWKDEDPAVQTPPDHPEANLFRGKKVRITVEVIE
jgi:hypothetical protein